MDTKKASAILKTLKPKQTRTRKGKSVARERAGAETAETAAPSPAYGPFWTRIFSIGKYAAPDKVNDSYIEIITDLQAELRRAYDRFERNTSSLREVEKYNRAKRALETKLKIIHKLRYSFSFMDHQRFIEKRDLNYFPAIPPEAVSRFLEKRTAVPASGLSDSLVGGFTERRAKREAGRRTETVATTSAGVFPTTNAAEAGTPRAARYSHDEFKNWRDYPTVPWVRGARGFVIAEPVEEKGYLLYLNGALVPRALAVLQDGRWWLRAKRPWLEHTFAHGRPFVPGKVGYLMADGSVREESEADYAAFSEWRRGRDAVGAAGDVETLFVGVSREFAQSVIEEARDVDELVRFLATLDAAVGNNKLHRMRFYSEHYKAKIVHLSPKEIFPEIFFNRELLQDRVLMFRSRLADAGKRIEVFLATGRRSAVPPAPPMTLPVPDIASNPNAFWYVTTERRLAVGDAADPPSDAHRVSKRLVECILPVATEDSDLSDLEEVFEGVKRPKLLAPNLFRELGRELDAVSGRRDAEAARRGLPRRLERTKGKIARFYASSRM